MNLDEEGGNKSGNVAPVGVDVATGVPGIDVGTRGTGGDLSVDNLFRERLGGGVGARS